MNGTLKKAFRWIALPVMLVVLLTCSAFATTETELTDVILSENTETSGAVDVKLQFTFATEGMQDAYLAWGRGNLDSETDGAISVVNTVKKQDSSFEKVNQGDYVELTLTFQMGASTTVSNRGVFYDEVEVAAIPSDVPTVKVRACAMQQAYKDSDNWEEWTGSYMLEDPLREVEIEIVNFSSDGVKIVVDGNEYSYSFGSGD